MPSTLPLRKLIALLSFTTALSLAPAAFAGEAQTLVQTRQNEIASMLQKPPSADRDKQIAASLASLFDFDLIAQNSMGKHWDELTAEQKTEFSGLLKRLIQRNLEKSIKTTLSYDVQFLGEEPADDGVLVKTRAVSKTDAREEPVEIDYTLKKEGSAWRAIDVKTEGSSLVNNYKNQFNRILSKDGYPALIKKMKSKLASGS